MSLLYNDNNISETNYAKKPKKDIKKIYLIKAFNDNKVKDYFLHKKKNKKNRNLISLFYSQSKNIDYDSNHNSMFKNVYKKPLKNKNKIYLTNHKFHTNNCIINRNQLNTSNIKKLNIYNNNIMNNNYIKINNKTIINNENSFSEVTSDHDTIKKEKLYDYNTFNISHIDNYNNIDKNFSVNKEKSNCINLKNKNIILNKKRSHEKNKIYFTKNNNININSMERLNTTRESKNINSINLISNKNINRINNPLNINKLFCLPNQIHKTNKINTYHPITTVSNSKNKKIKKKLNKKFLLNEIKIDNRKTNERCKPISSNYSGITEMAPNSRIEETEIEGLNLNKNKLETINIIERKRKILNSLEKEKQRIIDERYKSYKKYLSLIKRQEQEYEEYDQFLKKELNNNQNNKMKLKKFKDKLKLDSINTSHFNSIKNKSIITCLTERSSENKALSPHNLYNLKNRKKIIKKLFLPNPYKEKKLFISNDGFEPLLSEESRTFRSTKKRIIINLKDFNRFKKESNSKKNDYKINANNQINNKNNLNNIISNTKINNFSSDKLNKFNKSINADTLRNSKKYNNINNNELDNHINNNKNKLSLNNVKRKLLLKKMIKNFNTEKELKLPNNSYVSNSKNCHLKSNSLRKLENIDNYIDPKLTKSIPLPNNENVHKVISKEKKKLIISKIYNKKNKIPNNKDYYDFTFNSKKKQKNLSAEKNLNSLLIKNGLYCSDFKSYKYEDIY